MDFSHRVSVRYTVESAERELEIFNKLLSSKKDYPEKRKLMMDNYKIKREDLDN